MNTNQGPVLRINGSCEGCAWLHPIGAIRGLVYFCNEPSKRVGEFAKPTEIGRRPVTPAWCPLLPAARLALARSICNHCGADIAPDYLGLYAKPTCEKCANERTGDTTDECSAARGAGEESE